MSELIKSQIKDLVCVAIKTLQDKEVFPDFEIPEPIVDWPKDETFGDYTTSIAFQISKQVGKPPAQVASIMQLYLEAPFLKKTEVAGNGFINFYISTYSLLENLRNIIHFKEEYGRMTLGQGKTMVIDYSSPNIAKPFGIGHLRSTIIGQAIYNFYKFLGWNCIGENHLGDWGTQFGKLIYQIKKENVSLDSLTVERLEELYIKFHKELEVNPELENEGKNWFKKLTQGDSEAKEIWKVCRQISLQEFDRIYTILGIKIDNALGESFGEELAQQVIAEAKEKGVTKLSEGAWIIEFSEKNMGVQVLQKSDGATTYLARDLAAIKYRLEHWHPDLMVYETGVDQNLYFRQVFNAANMMGWTSLDRFAHVGHGLIRSKDGKFSTRKGQTIHLEEVLSEAIDKAHELMDSSKKDKELPKEEKEKLAKIIGIGAIKYNDLSQERSQDIIFDWEKVLNLRGNSGPYVQYTYARCQSVLERGKYSEYLDCPVNQLNDQEAILLGKLLKFREVIKLSAQEFSPHYLCNYVYDLCQAFNRFYDAYAIASSQDEGERRLRLNLSFGVGQVLKNSLNLLGIESPSRM